MHKSDLDIMQLADSAFPTGTYTMSNGIEYMRMSGHLKNADDIEELNHIYLANQAGPTDGAAVSRAHQYCESRDDKALRYLDWHVTAMKSVREGRNASVRSGTQLARCVADFVSDTTLDTYIDDISHGMAYGVYPVSFGICSHAMGIPRQKAVTTLLYGFVAGNVGAALRLGIIQHFEAQGIIHRLKPAIYEAANSDEFEWQFCPQAEIAQMSHEDIDEKMFIT